MKKFFAIVFLLSFVLAQYGKIVSYSYCKIKASIQAVTCDCEKKWLTDPNPNSNTAHLIMKEKSEEIYFNSEYSYNSVRQFDIQYFFPIKIATSEGIHFSLFHPPLI